MRRVRALCGGTEQCAGVLSTWETLARVLAERGAMTIMSAHRRSSMWSTGSPTVLHSLHSSSSPAIPNRSTPHHFQAVLLPIHSTPSTPTLPQLLIASNRSTATTLQPSAPPLSRNLITSNCSTPHHHSPLHISSTQLLPSTSDTGNCLSPT